jgi:hypothetical protein
VRWTVRPPAAPREVKVVGPGVAGLVEGDLGELAPLVVVAASVAYSVDDAGLVGEAPRRPRASRSASSSDGSFGPGTYPVRLRARNSEWPVFVVTPARHDRPSSAILLWSVANFESHWLPSPRGFPTDSVRFTLLDRQ